MSEYVKQAQSYAQQTLQHNMKGQEVIRRTAMCPIHTSQTSDFRGVTNEGWMFHCREKAGHDFTAKADPRAPKTQEEVEKWLVKQRESWLKSG